MSFPQCPTLSEIPEMVSIPTHASLLHPHTILPFHTCLTPPPSHTSHHPHCTHASLLHKHHTTLTVHMLHSFTHITPPSLYTCFTPSITHITPPSLYTCFIPTHPPMYHHTPLHHSHPFTFTHCHTVTLSHCHTVTLIIPNHFSSRPSDIQLDIYSLPVRLHGSTLHICLYILCEYVYKPPISATMCCARVTGFVEFERRLNWLR